MKTVDGHWAASAWRALFLAIAIVSLLFWTSFGYAEENETAQGGPKAVAAGEVTPTASAKMEEQQPNAEEQLPVISDLAYPMEMGEAPAPGEDFESDPWEPFNEKMFWFNREILDRYILKPVATAWDFVLPDQVQRGIHNVVDNLKVVQRVVNNSLQLKFTGAAKEV